jgi:hypothetical protein
MWTAGKDGFCMLEGETGAEGDESDEGADKGCSDA